MTPFLVKVCGLTRPADASLAWELGADMLGLIFYPGSPRYVSQLKAKRIMAHVGRPEKFVAVFVNEKTDHILETTDQLGISTIQLHGNEDTNFIRKLQILRLTVIKSISLRTRKDWSMVERCPADMVLLDNQTVTKPGGTGKSFDWSLIPEKHSCNVGLAGGIGRHNLEMAVSTVRPQLVDINSSVELSPGKKSVNHLREFFALANRIRYEKIPHFTSR